MAGVIARSTLRSSKKKTRGAISACTAKCGFDGERYPPRIATDEVASRDTPLRHSNFSLLPRWCVVSGCHDGVVVLVLDARHGRDLNHAPCCSPGVRIFWRSSSGHGPPDDVGRAWIAERKGGVRTRSFQSKEAKASLAGLLRVVSSVCLCWVVACWLSLLSPRVSSIVCWRCCC